MFIKLFDIKIVANSLLGFSNKASILVINLLLLSSGIFDLSNEKNATSQPDVRADKIRKTNIKIILIITGV